MNESQVNEAAAHLEAIASMYASGKYTPKEILDGLYVNGLMELLELIQEKDYVRPDVSMTGSGTTNVVVFADTYRLV